MQEVLLPEVRDSHRTSPAEHDFWGALICISASARRAHSGGLPSSLHLNIFHSSTSYACDGSGWSPPYLHGATNYFLRVIMHPGRESRVK